MKMRVYLWIIMAACLTAGCGEKIKRTGDPDANIGTNTKIAGDSTLYGLACEGCTDSVLVFLPGSGGDPVAYDILEATLHHRVIGRPKTGDWVAVLPDKEEKGKANMVINLDELKGQWVQMVAPTLRSIPIDDNLDESEQREIDSLLAERMKPVEIGFTLKRHYVAQPIGMFRQMQAKENDPVVFPVPRRYMEWHVFNGRLIMKVRPMREDTLNGHLEICDTAELLLLTRDSLRLRFNDGEKGYHRKK